MRLLPATLIALAAVAVPSVVMAEDEAPPSHDFSVSQQCVQFDGSPMLGPGEYRLIPVPVGTNGSFTVPAEATGLLLNGAPWPCGPIDDAPPTCPANHDPSTLPDGSLHCTPVVAAQPTTAQPMTLTAPVQVTAAAPATPSPYVAIQAAMLDLQDILVANGGW